MIKKLGVAVAWFAMAGCTYPANAKNAVGPLKLVRTSASAAPLQIAMYGDSTFVGWTKETGSYSVTNKNAPAQLQRMLTASGYNIAISNHGVTGSTSGDLLNGTGKVTQSWVAEMAASTANIVIINEGLNDAYAMNGGSETEVQFQSNYQQLVQIAQQMGKTVWIESENPRTDIDPHWLDVVSLVELSVAYGSTNVGYINMYKDILADMPNYAANLPDGIHPNDTLYTFKAAQEFRYLTTQISLPNNGQ